jgi:hypothetical protein
MKIAMVYADSMSEWNCSEWRQNAVCDAINKKIEQGELDRNKWSAKMLHVSGFVNFLDPAIQDIVMPVDVICFQRNLINDQVFDAIAYFKGLGKVFTADLDDQYQGLPFSNPAHAFWVENNSNLSPTPLKALEYGLGLCGALTAPNRLLLQDWAHVVTGYYVPNYARGEWWVSDVDRLAMRHERGIGDERIVIGWGGSVSHYDSWWGSGLREAAERVTQRHPEVLWMVCGNDPRIIDQLPVPVGNKYAQPGVPPQDWPKIVKMFDIGVAPLFGPYDQRRSWIKGIEYLLGAVPWIGATGEPYRELTGLGTLTGNGVDAWEAALEKKISNLKHEKEVALERVELAKQLFLIENNLDVYEREYGRIIENAQNNNPLRQVPHLYRVTAQKEQEQTNG